MVTSKLLFYKDYTQDGTGDVNTPKVIGQSGWGDYKFLFSGGNGIIYAVDQAGRLLFYRDETQDATGDIGAPKVIGLGGWQHFKFLFSGGNGIIYAVDQAGRLLFYRDYKQDGTGDVNTPAVIGLSGWQQYKFLFSGGNGIIYAVDQAGKLLFYRDNTQNGTGDVDIPKVIGLGGWDAYKFLFSGGNGIIYAVTLKSTNPRDHRTEGRLLFYRDYKQDGTGDVDTPKVIGQGGWDVYKFLFSGGKGAIYAVDNVIMKPNAPSALKVTEVADRKISVSWIDNSNNENEFLIRFVGKRTGFSDHTGSKSVARNTISTSLTGLRSNNQYTISAVALNSDGESPKSNEVHAETPARTISVSKEVSGANLVFTVTGSGFTPNSLVVIKITAQNWQPVQFQSTAGADGTFVQKQPVICLSSFMLTFTSYEDADPTGTFANAIIMACP